MRIHMWNLKKIARAVMNWMGSPVLSAATPMTEAERLVLIKAEKFWKIRPELVAACNEGLGVIHALGDSSKERPLRELSRQFKVNKTRYFAASQQLKRNFERAARAEENSFVASQGMMFLNGMIMNLRDMAEYLMNAVPPQHKALYARLSSVRDQLEQLDQVEPERHEMPSFMQQHHRL